MTEAGNADAAAERTPGGTPGRAIWQQILSELMSDIEEGRYPPGARLPTEAALAQRFGVNRHTVRRALQTLRDKGRIHVRRGAGAVVTAGRFDYRISARTRFTQNLIEGGKRPDRETLRCEVVRATEREAERLGIEPGAAVVLYEVIARANGVPVSYGRSVFPSRRLPGLATRLVEMRSVTAALAATGVGDYARVWTRLTAERPGTTVARHLRMGDEAPVLLSESLNADLDGRPVEYGLTWFCSERIALVVEGSGISSTETGGAAPPAGRIEGETA